MQISLVAAMSRDRVIGARGQLPWRMPGDLARFKALTLGKPVLMGRKTFDSIGRPLPGRRNLVISRADVKIPGCEVFSSLGAALDAARASGAAACAVIGGGQLFAEALPCADLVHLTVIELDVPDGDTFFPPLDPACWQPREEILYPASERDPHPCRLITYQRTPRDA